MGRTTTLLIWCWLLIGARALAQQSAPQTPEDAYTSRELIAWSQLQVPQPTPEPLPPREARIPQPEQPRDEQPKSPADPHAQPEPLASYTGVVIRQSGRYFLCLANNTAYQLDVEDGFERYDKRNVTIIGSLSLNGQIKVFKVEAL